MSGWVWVVILVAVLVVIAGVAWRAFETRRSRALQERFGPEYERAAELAGSRREAEVELADRQERRERMVIRPLPSEARRRYAERWQMVPSEFIDAPTAAVAAADALVDSVMSARGYPPEDFQQRAADVSVDHPQLVESYRSAHEISRLSAEGRATTEQLRQAILNYQALFDQLLAEDEPDAPFGSPAEFRDQIDMAETAARMRR